MFPRFFYLAFAILLVAPAKSFAFDREVLSLSSSTKWGLFQGKQFVINVTSDTKGLIGSILSNVQRTSLTLKFEKASPHEMTEEQYRVASQKLGAVPKTNSGVF